MPENSWLENERKYFIETKCDGFKVSLKILSEVLRKYNLFLQRALIGESPYVAEDLKLTMLKSKEDSGNNK